MNPIKKNEMNYSVRYCKECEKLKMKVSLQEGNVPFPGMKAEYGHKMLVRRAVGEKSHKNETLITQIGNYAYYKRDKIRGTAFLPG